MLLLSSILGPAKPPVATREEVNSAPGVFIINGTRDSLFAEASNGDQVQIPPGERCLVCLSDYEPKEEVRQLTNCRHLFHRDCIDQVRHPPRLVLIANQERCSHVHLVVNNRA
jgi:hypothetical protein